MTNIFQLLLVSVVVTLTLLMTIVAIQVLIVINDFKQLIKKVESTAELPKFYRDTKDMLKDGTSTVVKVKQFFNKK